MNEVIPGAPAGKKALAVFAVVEKENRNAIWIRVGSAFTNRDGSVNLYLDAFPIGTNRLQIREQRFEDGRWGQAVARAGTAPASRRAGAAADADGDAEQEALP
jgi:hypothetical protein